MTESPFNDLRQVLTQLPDADNCAPKKIITNGVQEIVNDSSDLLGLKKWLAVWQGSAEPKVDEAHICVLASSYKGYEKSSVTDFVAKASKGQATVNRLCVDRGVGLRVLELAPDIPHDIHADWQEADCMAAVAFGMEAAAAGGHLLGLSDVAPGNIKSALAIVCGLTGGSNSPLFKEIECFHASTGSATLHNEVVELVAEAESNENLDALALLLKCGGREIAASIGGMIAARSRRIPVVVDGWSAIAALAILEAECPGSTDHVHISACENLLAAKLAQFAGKPPLIAPYVSSGPGCGNAVSVAILKAACDL